MTAANRLKPIVQGLVSRFIDKSFWIGLAAIAAILLGWIGFNFLSSHAITITTNTIELNQAKSNACVA